MEGVGLIDKDFWRGRRVLVTGHTGFKGAWLSVWLHRLGAVVAGYALAPAEQPTLFESIGLGARLEDHRGDLRDSSRLCSLVAGFDPEVVFHLAAQPLVLRGYRDPVETFSVNVVGTATLLESCRHARGLRAVVVVTTDKCYANREWVWPYREDDALGGHDPYSTSKACAELVAEAFRTSFFGEPGGAGIATARAGNVIGGGDWAEDRLVPDAARSVIAKRPLVLRRPASVRPWQHVLEPLHGYLLLAQALAVDPRAHSGPWNFGPANGDHMTVSDVVEALAARWEGRLAWQVDPASERSHEASRLTIDSTKAATALGWRPNLGMGTALDWTVRWYDAHEAGARDLMALSEEQIDAYCRRHSG